MEDGDVGWWWMFFGKTVNVCPIHLKLAQKLGAMNLFFCLIWKLCFVPLGRKHVAASTRIICGLRKSNMFSFNTCRVIKIWVFGPLFRIDVDPKSSDRKCLFKNNLRINQTQLQSGYVINNTSRLPSTFSLRFMKRSFSLLLLTESFLQKTSPKPRCKQLCFLKFCRVPFQKRDTPLRPGIDRQKKCHNCHNHPNTITKKNGMELVP